MIISSARKIKCAIVGKGEENGKRSEARAVEC